MSVSPYLDLKIKTPEELRKSAAGVYWAATDESEKHYQSFGFTPDIAGKPKPRVNKQKLYEHIDELVRRSIFDEAACIGFYA